MQLSVLLSVVALLATGVFAKPHPKNPLIARQGTACANGCTSASDQAALQAIEACDPTNLACFCAGWNQLGQDPSCAPCLQEIDVTGYLAQECASGNLPTGVASATGTASAAGATETGNTDIAQCESSCTSSSDQAALAQIQTTTCAQDAACVCTTLESLSSGCMTCILTTEYLTVDDLHSECDPILSVSASSGGAATGGPTQSSGASAGGSSPTSAAPAGGSSAAGGSASGGSAPASSSPAAAGHSGALPAVDVRMAMVVLGGVVAGAMMVL